MPGMPHAWCCEASAMKVFLLLGFLSLTTSLDAEVSPASVIEQEETTDVDTMEPLLFSTSSSYMAEGLADARNELNFLQELETTNASEAITTVATATETSTMGIVTTSDMKTRLAGVTPSEVPPDDQKRKADLEEIDYNHDFFHYDYHFLRKWGLVAAAILFILGILILTCGKHGKFPRCHGKKRARTYDVAQA